MGIKNGHEEAFLTIPCWSLVSCTLSRMFILLLLETRRGWEGGGGDKKQSKWENNCTFPLFSCSINTCFLSPAASFLMPIWEGGRVASINTCLLSPAASFLMPTWERERERERPSFNSHVPTRAWLRQMRLLHVNGTTRAGDSEVWFISREVMVICEC